MIIQALVCFGAWCVFARAKKNDGKEPRSVPARPDDPFDRALGYAVGAGYSPEQCVAYVANRVAPGRDDPETISRVAQQCSRRLADPGFPGKCGCRG
jgi:hypothetical protein